MKDLIRYKISMKSKVETIATAITKIGRNLGIGIISYPCQTGLGLSINKQQLAIFRFYMILHKYLNQGQASSFKKFRIYENR